MVRLRSASEERALATDPAERVASTCRPNDTSNEAVDANIDDTADSAPVTAPPPSNSGDLCVSASDFQHSLTPVCFIDVVPL